MSHQRRVVETSVRGGPTGFGKKHTSRQRFVSDHRRDAGWLSRPGPNKRRKKHRNVAGNGFCRCACPTAATEFEDSPQHDRANRSGADGENGAEPAGCVSRIVAKTIPCRLSGTERMEGAAGAAPGNCGGKCPPVADSAAWRCWIGAADWVRERCKSASCSRECERSRDGCSAGVGSRTKAVNVATSSRRLTSFVGGRDRRTGDSLLH